MRNGKALFACAAFAGAAIGAMAAPTKATDITLSQDPDTGLVTVTYKLTGDEDVIVTPELLTNGVPLAASETWGFFGDMNRVLAPSNEPHVAYWQPRVYWPDHQVAASELECKLTCWSKASPPDYMAVDLAVTNRLMFYASAEAVPGGVGDVRYKTDILLMRKIPAAGHEFVMGSPRTEKMTITTGKTRTWGCFELGGSAAHDMKAHNVILTNDYYVGIYELTFGQFRTVLGIDPPYEYVAGPDDPKKSVRAANGFQQTKFRIYESAHWPRDGHEVASASYMAKFRAMSGLEIDLPTEAQWEYACRAGTTTQLYTGEDLLGTTTSTNLDRIAWYKGNNTNDQNNAVCSKDETLNIPHEVGLLEPNAFGLYDMLGNLNEACLDAVGRDSKLTTDPANGEEQIEPVGAEASAYDDRRARRGGGVNENASAIRCGRRCSTSVSWTDAAFGVRLACPAVIP